MYVVSFGLGTKRIGGVGDGDGKYVPGIYYGGP